MREVFTESPYTCRSVILRKSVFIVMRSAEYLGWSVSLTSQISMLHRLHVDETIIQSSHSISSIDPNTDSIELVVHRNHLDSNLSMNIGNERDQRMTITSTSRCSSYTPTQ